LWRRLAGFTQWVYEVNPLMDEKCGYEMKVISVITDPQEMRKILECMKWNKVLPFDKIAIKTS